MNNLNIKTSENKDLGQDKIQEHFKYTTVKNKTEAQRNETELTEQQIIMDHIINGHPRENSTIRTYRLTRTVSKKEGLLIKNIIKTCHLCQLNKTGIPLKHGLIKGHLSTDEPFKHISTDVFGPFDATEYKSDFE